MSKTGFQTQRGVGWAAEYVARSGCTFWMGIDNFPILSCKVIGRVYYPQENVDHVVTMGAFGADLVFGRAEPIIRTNPHVYAWVLLNEASIWNAAVRAGFPAFNQRLTSRLADLGMKHVACNVNVGHPDKTYWDAGIDAIGDACPGAYALGLHGYSWPSLETGWSDYVGRFERIYASLRAKGYSPPPCLMTELGLDRAVTGQGHAGWREVPLSSQQLAEQIAGFEARVAGNADLLGALWFLAGAGSPWDGYGFDVDRDTAMLIADKIANVTPLPSPSPSPAPATYALGVDASKWQTDIDWQVVWDHGARFVIWKLGQGVTKDPLFEQYWTEISKLGFLRGVYHVLEPAVDNQATFIRDTLAGRVPELGIWGDFEVAGLDAARIDRYVTYVKQVTGLPVGVYSRASLLNSWMPLSSTVTGCDLWIASPGQPTPVMPDAWDTWKFWQFGQRIIDGRTVDVNHYNGTVAQLFEKYGVEQPSPSEEEQMAGLTFFNRDGTEMTEAAFRAVYGNFRVESPAGSKYHLIELWDSGAGVYAGMDFQAYVRPQYPTGARLVILNGGKAYGSVKAPDMQEGAVWACYAPPDVGAYTVTIEASEPADSLVGAGWICETGHRHIQRYVFEYSDEEPPEPPPDDEGVAYFHKDGSPMPYSEVVTMFGPQEIYKPAAEYYPLYRVDQLHWQDGVHLSPRVLDKYLLPVRDALVGIQSKKTGAVRKALTGPDGYCSFDLSDGDWSYNAGAETGPVVCGLAKLPCQVYNSAGKVNDRNLGPRVLNPVFIWTEKEEPPTTYALTVSIEGQGSVIVSPLLSVYPAGTVVTLKAVASPGWEFWTWDGDVIGDSNPIVLTMSNDKALSAVFVESDVPPDDVETLILEARALLAEADAKLVAALALL